ncbi:MAG: hypothetical protein ACOZBL_01730 [Patescibacteria group bacterium]
MGLLSEIQIYFLPPRLRGGLPLRRRLSCLICCRCEVRWEQFLQI